MESTSTVVHISEIPLSVKESDIKQYFREKMGADIRIGTIRAVKNKDIPLQWARVDFRTPEFYQRAIEEYRFPTFVEGIQSRLLPNDREIISKEIAEKNVFIKGLDKVRYDHRELYELFKQFGWIDACKVSKTVKQENNKFISNSNGYGFVKFNDKDVAMAVYREAKLADPNIVIEPYLKERKKPQPNNLYVKNFSNDVDEAVLTEIFQKYGEIASVKVILDPAANKKFGYVCFKDEQSATDALEMHESAVEPYSDWIYVQRHLKKSARKEHLAKTYKRQNLFVRNFGEEVTEKDLRDLFSSYGSIANVKILTKKVEVNGDVKEVSQCKGFVWFELPDDAKRAVDDAKERGIWFDAKRLNVSFFEPRSEREQQKSATKSALNPDIEAFLMNFFQIAQGGMMGMSPMNAPPPLPPQPMGPPRSNYMKQPPPPRGPPRPDQSMPSGMYGQRPGPQPGMPGFAAAPGFAPGMMGPEMQMMPQPGFGQMKPGPMPGMNPMMAPQMAPRMPPVNVVSEDTAYLQQYNELISSQEYDNCEEDEKKNKIGDLIYPYVEKIAGPDNAPKITGMIIDLDMADLESSTSSLMQLHEKIKEGMELLQDEPQDD